MRDVVTNDFAVAIGWPETYCKQPGYWFDSLGRVLGINKNGFYKIGHSAVILINSTTNKCHYFDFGRYHTPFQKGRVRDDCSDPSLTIKTIPQIDLTNRKILNLKQIIEDMQLNTEYHSEGKLIAAYTRINFQLAYKFAINQQKKELIPYGLLNYSKMNCGRFVSRIIRAGMPVLMDRFKLKYLILLVPSTLSNVNALKNKIVIPHRRHEPLFYPSNKMTKTEQKTVLAAPAKIGVVGKNAKWLGGEGMGAWFDIIANGSSFSIKRWTDLGILESVGNFKIDGSLKFDDNAPFILSYPSNSQIVVVIQMEEKIMFEKI